MRSALAAALVVLVSFGIVAAAVAAVLYRQLLADVDAAAQRRARDVVAGLQQDPPQELDAGLLTTDTQIVAVQVLDSSGAVVRASAGTPMTPMTAWGTGSRHADDSGEAEGQEGVRVSQEAGAGPDRDYTVLVGAASGAAASTVKDLALLLAAAMPFVVAGAAAATFVLVRRSLGSVEVIRAEVADISAHDLSGRVPVPAHRDEISALAATMNDMLARIESGQAAQRRFVGDASHELR
ncbi:MAG TPA: HAMP domain-containing protein, partial [Mycobacterium sp.]|nr:HAMP domain-containing protein [Mycobacterium sp.]